MDRLWLCWKPTRYIWSSQSVSVFGVVLVHEGLRSLAYVGELLVGYLDELLGVEEVVHPGRGTEAHPSVIVDLYRTALALLGGDQDDAVGCAGAVDGCGGTVLQDFEGLDVGGIDVGHGVVVGIASAQTARGYRHTVDHIEGRGSGGDGVDAADDHFRRSTDEAGGGYLDSGGPSGQLLDEAGGGVLGYIIALDLGDGAGDILFHLHAVSHHYQFLQAVALHAHLSIHYGAAAYRYVQILHTDQGEEQCGVRTGDGDSVCTVVSGSGESVRAFDRDVYVGQRLPVFRDSALDFVCGVIGAATGQRKCYVSLFYSIVQAYRGKKRGAYRLYVRAGAVEGDLGLIRLYLVGVDKCVVRLTGDLVQNTLQDGILHIQRDERLCSRPDRTHQYGQGCKEQSDDSFFRCHKYEFCCLFYSSDYAESRTFPHKNNF